LVAIGNWFLGGVVAYLGPPGVLLHERLVVSEGVVVKEEPGCNVEGYEDVDRVVLVGCQDEEDSEHVQ